MGRAMFEGFGHYTLCIVRMKCSLHRCGEEEELTWTNDVPEDTGVIDLAYPAFRRDVEQPGYSLAFVDLPSNSLPETCTPLPEEVRTTVISAMSYPPALALARHRVHFADGEPPTPDEFVQEYAAMVQSVLDSQPTNGAFLARALVNDRGFDYVMGQYLWLLGRSGDRVLYVTYHFWIGDAPAAHFDIRQELFNGLKEMSWLGPD